MSIAKPISEFLKQPREHDIATLLGKGPSLDLYDPARDARGYVIGVNEVPLVLPCNAVCYMDAKCNDLCYPDDVAIIRYAAMRGSHNGRGYYFTSALTHILTQSSDLRRFGAGSISYAIALMGMWGIRSMRLWGCDCLMNGTDTTYGVRMHATALWGRANPGSYAKVAAGMRAALAEFNIATELCGVSSTANC